LSNDLCGETEVKILLAVGKTPIQHFYLTMAPGVPAGPGNPLLP